jgi:hypothetical protein
MVKGFRYFLTLSIRLFNLVALTGGQHRYLNLFADCIRPFGHLVVNFQMTSAGSS